jgi:hypothetical protein
MSKVSDLNSLGVSGLKKKLCNLSHTPSPFGFSYFLNRLLCFCTGPAWDRDPSTHARALTPCLLFEIGYR